MEPMMELLISKFDEMFSRQRVLSHKKKKVKMPIIRAIVNGEIVGHNSKVKEKKFSKAND